MRYCANMKDDRHKQEYHKFSYTASTRKQVMLDARVREQKQTITAMAQY